MNKCNNFFEISSTMSDHDVRIGSIIWLAAENYESPSDNLRDFLDDHAPEEMLQILGLPDRGLVSEMCDLDMGRNWDVVSEMLSYYRGDEQRLGLLIRCETPVYEYTDEHSANASWGLTTWEWFYVESLDDAVKKAVEWAEKTHEEHKKKSLAREAS